VEQFGTTCHLISAPQWPHSVCDDPGWLDRVGKKPSVKSRPWEIYKLVVAVINPYSVFKFLIFKYSSVYGETMRK